MADTPQSNTSGLNSPAASADPQNARVQTAQASIVTKSAERQTIGASLEAARVLNEKDDAAALATAIDAIATVLDTTVR